MTQLTLPPNLNLQLPHSPTRLLPAIAGLIVNGLLPIPIVLRQLIEHISSLSPSHPFSLLTTRLLSLHYFHLCPQSTTFLHNTLIRCYSNTKLPQESLIGFVRMVRLGCLPDNFTFPFVVKAAAKRKGFGEGEQVFGQVWKRGFCLDVYVVNNLISYFLAVGDLGDARKLFESSRGVVDVVSWNSIIDGYVKVGDMGNAWKLFDEMPVRNDVSWSAIISSPVFQDDICRPENRTTPLGVVRSRSDGCLLNRPILIGRLQGESSCSQDDKCRPEKHFPIISGYAGEGKLDVAQSLFDRMPYDGKNVVTWNSMVSGFAKHGLLPLARKFFDEMLVRNLISWNAMVSGYAVNGQMDLARGLFDEMQHKDVVSWSSMISGYVQINRHREALELFKAMQTENRVKPSEVTLISVLSACAHLAALNQGEWVHAYIDKNQMTLDDDDNLGPALIDMYAKCGNVDAATEIFWNLNRKNVSAWNSLITGLAVNGLARESLDIFTKMQASGTKPNDVTFVGVLTTCTHGGLVDEGRFYFKRMSEAYGIQPQMKHYGCIVDLLGRSGFLTEAEGVVRNMPMKPDGMVLGALLGACRIHRNIQIADRLREDFLELMSKEAGCHILLSNIYASAGMWSDSLEMRCMLKRKGIRKEPGFSSVEMDGTVHEFVAGDCSHPQTTEIHSWLDKILLKLRSEGYLPVTEDVLVDLSTEDKEIWLSWHSEKLAVAFALLRARPDTTIRIVKNLRICGDCHSFIKHVSRSCSHVILVRDRIRFHHFKGGSCSCRDFW